MMDLSKILKRICDKLFLYDNVKDITMTSDRVIGIWLAGTDIKTEWKDNIAPEYTENKINPTWGYTKEHLLEALDILEGKIKVIAFDKASPLILEDDVFQIRIAPMISELDEDEDE